MGNLATSPAIRQIHWIGQWPHISKCFISVFLLYAPKGSISISLFGEMEMTNSY